MTNAARLPSLTVIVGASGGLGASTLTLACALHQAGQTGSATAIDLDLRSGGLDVSGAIEDQAGVRWPDLARAEGSLTGEALRARLPMLGRARVLSAGRVGATPAQVVIDEVLRALVDDREPATADLPRQSDLLPPTLARAGRVLLMAGATTRSLADLGALVSALPPDHGEAGIVLRFAGRGAIDEAGIEDHFNLPIAATLASDSRVAGQAERGRWPLTPGRAPARAAATLWERGWLG